MRVFGPNELVADVLNKDFCIGCGACTEMCPYFKSYKGKTSMLFSCTRQQGRCHAYCPKAEVDLDEISNFLFGKAYEGTPLGSYQKVLISKAGPNMIPGNFQAGGTVSALVTHALRKGRIDAAVLTDWKGLFPVPKLVTRPEDAVRCASSKYVTAPTLSMLNRAQELKFKRVGIVGTPCQLTAVAKIRTNPLNREDFEDTVGLTVGLFCTWTLDARELVKYLSARMDVEKIKKLDIPPPPSEVLIVTTVDDKIRLPLSEIRPMVPRSCSICPDMTAEWADVSVGVSEASSEWNTLIIRTEKGAELVDGAEKSGFLVTDRMPKESFEHLCTAAGGKKARAFRQALKDGCLNTADDGHAVLRVNPAVIEGMRIEPEEDHVGNT
jgi:coenzyme F420 hydrogenase subunit beta